MVVKDGYLKKNRFFLSDFDELTYQLALSKGMIFNAIKRICIKYAS